MGTRSHAGQHGGAGSAGTSSRRSTHHESAAPSPDSQTFRDLLIFEERLKQSASRLQKRKRKYESECSAVSGLKRQFLCPALTLSSVSKPCWCSAQRQCCS